MYTAYNTEGYCTLNKKELPALTLNLDTFHCRQGVSSLQTVNICTKDSAPTQTERERNVWGETRCMKGISPIYRV